MQYDELTDEELVSRIQAGAIEGFEELIRRYQQKLFRFAVRITHEENDAEEIVQDALFALYRTIDRVDTSRKFSSYAFAITKHQAFSYLRRKRPTIPLEAIQDLESSDDVKATAIKSDQAQQIQQALGHLKKTEAKAVRLYYFSNLSYQEISRHLNMPLNTVRTLLHRAKKTLARIVRYEKN